MSIPETATSYSVGPGAHSPRVKGQRCQVAANLYLVQSLGIPEDILSLSHMPSWRAEGQHFLYFYKLQKSAGK